MSTTTSAVCKNHRRREAVSTCSSCGSPLCADCMIGTQVGFKCADCVNARPGSGPASARRGRERPGFSLTKGKRPWMLLAGGLAVVVVAGGLFFTRERGGSPRAGVSADQAELAVQLRGAGNLLLGGNLALPEQAKAGKVPAVLIIPGSGPTNRNGVLSAGTGGAPDPFYEDIALTLQEAGIASLRYDKRGGVNNLPPETPLTFEDMIADAQAGLKFLQERREIDPARVALVGHDEGGWIAMKVAAGSPQVRGIVLLSTPGRPLVDVLADDLTRTAPNAEEAERQPRILREVVAGLLAAGTVPERNTLPPALQPVFFRDRVQYLKSIFSLNPLEDARKVSTPVLLVRGARETGVSDQDLVLLNGALGGKADVVVGRTADHTLRVPVVPTGAVPSPGASISAEEDHDQAVHRGVTGSDRRDQETLSKITAWLHERLGASS